MSSIASEPELLEAARRGEEDAFRLIVGPHQRELHAHCYRMLGSLHDAEDALQDTLLRAWRGLPKFAGSGLVRPWLYRIATNVCLDAIARRSKRLPPDYGPGGEAHGGPGGPVHEPVWLEPYPDETLGLEDGYTAPAARYERRESVELAFIAALQHLPARQRAVLILRDVLAFSAREVADLLEATVASVTSALQRARKTMDERLPEQSQQATLRSLGDERIRDLVASFVDAWDSGDIDAILSILTADLTFAMPPFTKRHRGRDAMAAFLPAPPVGRWRLVPVWANGQLAFGAYQWDARTGRHRAAVLDVVTLRGARIAAVTAFATPEIFPRFGLADELLP
jgi:RNA polymerase sigma-70 factor (ECF subfamily)